MQKQEDALLNRIRKGERKAMEELYDNYAPVLLGVARRYCSRMDEAEDMLQESLLKILKGINDFKPAFEGAFEAWMRRITVNQCLSSLRKNMDFSTLEMPLKEEPFEINDESNENNRMYELTHEDIIEMLQSLPAGYRTVLNLYVFERMSHKEIAGELNITESTSKSQLSKARSIMRRKLELMTNAMEAKG